MLLQQTYPTYLESCRSPPELVTNSSSFYNKQMLTCLFIHNYKLVYESIKYLIND